MRLRAFHDGQRRRARVALRLMGIVSRTAPDPVARMILYRPELFGRPFVRLLRSVMRGRSQWSESERELIAAHVSRLNTCPFCAGVHSELASMLAGPTRADQLDRWRDGEFGDRLTATFALLERVTLHPDEVGASDVARVRAAGVPDAAIEDALYVCFLFDTVNRLANAFDFHWDTEADRMRLAAGLKRGGYRLPGYLVR